MACKSAAAFNSAGSGFSEALGSAAVCLDLGHDEAPYLLYRGNCGYYPLFFYFGSDNHIHIAPFYSRLVLYDRHILQLFGNPFDNRPSDIHMRDLATPEHKSYLGFVALFQKTLDVLDLEFQIVIISFRTELDFLKQNVDLFLFCFLQLFALLILELAIIHDSADRGNCRWRNLDKIKLLLFGQFQGFGNRNYTQRLTIRTDNSHFGNPDGLVDINGRFCYGDTS